MKEAAGYAKLGPLNRSMRARMTVRFTVALATLLILAGTSVVAYWNYADQLYAKRLLVECEEVLRHEMAEPTTRLRQPLQFAEEESLELQTWGVTLLLLDEQDRLLFAPNDYASTYVQSPLGQTWTLAREEWISRRVPWRGKTVVLLLPDGTHEQELRQFSYELAGLGFLLLAALAVGIWIMVGRTLAPLELLSQQALARQSQAGVTGAQAQLESPTDDWEMTHLVSTINGLLARLDADTRAKARFYAAASHELRTPLQSLSGFLELGLSRERSADEYRAALQEAQEQSRDLITLVNDLLTLNQLENTDAPVTADEVDLIDVCERTLQRLGPRVAERELRLNFEAGTTEVLQAPWSHAEMLVRNLLENAVKYASEGGWVRVQCEGDRFEVFNECEKSVDWDKERIFEPFFRPDDSRNSQTGGNGLGLAICKAICDANGWKLAVWQLEDGVFARVVFGTEAGG